MHKLSTNLISSLIFSRTVKFMFPSTDTLTFIKLCHAKLHFLVVISHSINQLFFAVSAKQHLKYIIQNIYVKKPESFRPFLSSVMLLLDLVLDWLEPIVSLLSTLSVDPLALKSCSKILPESTWEAIDGNSRPSEAA